MSGAQAARRLWPSTPKPTLYKCTERDPSPTHTDTRTRPKGEVHEVRPISLSRRKTGCLCSKQYV